MAKSILKYAFSTALAFGLLYWAFSTSHIEWQDIYTSLKQANYSWVGISVGIALFSHLLRALRWEQLLATMGYFPGTTRTISAVMIGYFANFIIPRMGEVSRCGSLQKTASIPFEKSFGTVITERIVDLLSLLILVAITFLVEWEPIQAFLFPNVALPSTYLILTLLVSALIVFRIIYIKKDTLFARWDSFSTETKIGKLVLGWVSGIRSIQHLDSPWTFISYTIGIWIAYFASTYTILLAFPISENLSLRAGLTILVMGTFGMATPTQGGIGAYHKLVIAALGFYLIPLKESTVLATFFHGTQMATILLLGGLSFIITLLLPQIDATNKQ